MLEARRFSWLWARFYSPCSSFFQKYSIETESREQGVYHRLSAFMCSFGNKIADSTNLLTLCGVRRARDTESSRRWSPFNPLAPRGARPMMFVVAAGRAEFQSTRPVRGETVIPCKLQLRLPGSQTRRSRPHSLQNDGRGCFRRYASPAPHQKAYAPVRCQARNHV